MASQAKKKAIARNYAKKKTTRHVVQRRQAAPLYRPMRSHYTKPSITGSGKYGLRNAGQDIGRGVGHVLERIFGSGDYEIRANSIMGGIYDPPELHNKSDRTVCMRHREYICDISASSAFSLQSFSINPGLFTTFPWLSQVADAFEEYRFTGLVFEYKTLSADYTTASSAALGYVIMSTQYNVNNPDFADKVTMENYEFSNSGKPSASFLHPVECKRSLNPVSELFVRTGEVTIGDLRLSDHGKFQIATGGNTGSGVLGELWCTFEVEFYKPKLTETIGSDCRTDHYYSLAANINNAAPLGIPLLVDGSSLGTTITGAGNNVINFPANMQTGYYLVNYQVTGSSTAVVGPLITSSNVTFVNAWENDTAGTILNGGTTSTVFINMFICQITGQNASITIGLGGTLPSSPTSMDLWITQLNSDVMP